MTYGGWFDFSWREVCRGTYKAERATRRTRGSANCMLRGSLRSAHSVRFALRATAVLFMRFCEIVHMMPWFWMRFAMYLHWNHTE